MDVSRLLSRGDRGNATGIDRVDMAYARRLLGLDIDLSFVAVAGKALLEVPREAMIDHLDRLAARWAGATEAGDPDPRLIAFLRGGAGGSLLPPDRAGLLPTGLTFATFGNGLPAPLRRAVGLPRRLRQQIGAPEPGPPALYLNVSHHHLEKPWLATAARRLGAERFAFLIHDVIPIDFPEYARPGHAEKHWERIRLVARAANLAIVNSADTGDRLARRVGELGRRDLPIVDALLGVDHLPRRATPLEPRAVPYFVTVGTIEARKNHLLLLNIWRELAARHGAACPRLVVVGRRGWEVESVIDMLERSEALRPVVLEAGALDDAVLRGLMAGARAVLMPSWTEGYGFPVAEALALGVPVIASDLAPHREIGFGVPDLLDPLDTMGWLAAIEDFARPVSLRRGAQMERMPAFRPVTWDEHFARVLPVLGLSPDGDARRRAA